MATQGWQAIRSTNAGILVENAKYVKVFQNTLNNSPKVPVLFQVGDLWNTVTGLSQLSNSQFSFPAGYFQIHLGMEAFSPTSAKLQIRITAEVATIVQVEIGYSGLTIATDFNNSSFVATFRVAVAGTVVEFFGEQSGAGGILEVNSGVLNIIRLYNAVV